MQVTVVGVGRILDPNTEVSGMRWQASHFRAPLPSQVRLEMSLTPLSMGSEPPLGLAPSWPPLWLPPQHTLVLCWVPPVSLHPKRCLTWSPAHPSAQGADHVHSHLHPVGSAGPPGDPAPSVHGDGGVGLHQGLYYSFITISTIGFATSGRVSPAPCPVSLPSSSASPPVSAQLSLPGPR